MEESKGGQTWAGMWGTHWEHNWEPLWCVSVSVCAFVFISGNDKVCVSMAVRYLSLSPWVQLFAVGLTCLPVAEAWQCCGLMRNS